MSSLWYTGKVGTADDLNKSFNVGVTSDVDDGTEVPTTVGEGIFQADNPRINLSQDGETYALQIPVIVAVPATATSQGAKGQFASDASGNYLYYCYATDSWRRVALTTF